MVKNVNLCWSLSNVCYSMEAGGMTPGKDLDKSLSGEQK